jgi:hypothetical protein
MTVETRTSQDYEGRAFWLALVAGLVLVFRAGARGFALAGGSGHVDFQIWMYVLSLVAFGVCVLLCLPLVIPELRAKLGPQLRDRRLSAWAFGLFALGVVLTVVAFAEGAIDSLDEERQFG